MQKIEIKRTFPVLLILGILTGLSFAKEDAKDVMFRVRVVKLTPAQPTMIHWTYGGRGLGGDPVPGWVTREKPDAPSVKETHVGNTLEGFDAEEFTLENKPADRIIVEGPTYNTHYLNTGVWSRALPLSHFNRHRGRFIVTFLLTGHKTASSLKDCEIEFEFTYRGKTIKSFTVRGEGPIFGVVIPFNRLNKDGSPMEEFAAEVGGLYEYVQEKITLLESEPWIQKPVPQRYGIFTDCGGWQKRTWDQPTMLGEFQTLHLMGLNGLRASNTFFDEMIRNNKGLGANFRRVKESHVHMSIMPTISVADKQKPVRRPGDGCPYFPKNLEGIDERCAHGARKFIEDHTPFGLEEVWGLTGDEIGSWFGKTPEGSAHMGCCPYCQEGFREMIRKDGRTLAEFGTDSWEDVRPIYGYWTKNYWESLAELQAAVSNAEVRMTASAQTGAISADDLKRKTGDSSFLNDLSLEDKPKVDTAGELMAAKKRLEELEWSTKLVQIPEEQRKPRLSEAGWSLLQYYTRLFNCESTAKVYEHIAKAFDAQNERKRQALAKGEKNTPEAVQPWIYSFALRQPAFLWGGHSLGAFNYYRYADNGFMFETSNRDYRTWQWESYLCDVGRSVTRFMDKPFGIYIKPHRGAPIQRALTFIARGGRVIFWYTYGPEWSKGDSFGGSAKLRRDVAWTSRLLAGAEEVTYESEWAVPAEVAIVRPRTAEFFGSFATPETAQFKGTPDGSAGWENGKWVHEALMHAHIPMDALDEDLLLSEDLRRYKVIVISGSYIRRKVAEKLKSWVSDGGTLYTCGWGMVGDESRQPLETLYPVFGVKSRGSVAIWGSVPRYGATSLGAVKPIETPPADAQVTGKLPLKGSFVPVVGREVLDPAPGAEVMATYADGRAAAIRNRFGKGTAWLIGTYAGVEYAWETMQRKPFDDDKRGWIATPVLSAGVKPVVDANHPMVEGVLLRKAQTGKQAAVLMNWDFAGRNPTHKTNLVVNILSPAPVSKVRSLALDRDLTLSQRDGIFSVTLPQLAEGDILLLD